MSEKPAILFFSIEEIIELAKNIEPRSAIDAGKIDFVLSKIKSKKLSKNFKDDLAELSAILWHDFTTLHPLSDGNKRLATETVKLFLKLNGFRINTIINGFVFISLKLANNEMTQKELNEWIKERLVEE